MSRLSSLHSAIVSGTYSTDASDREEFIGLQDRRRLRPRAEGCRLGASGPLHPLARRPERHARPAFVACWPRGLLVREVRIGFYRTLSGLLSAECIAGPFAMPTLAGPSVDPLDGTKILGGCGPGRHPHDLRTGDRWAFRPCWSDGGVLAGSCRR